MVNSTITEKEIKFRPAIKEDAADFIDLMNRQYPTKKKPVYFYWMYINNFLPTLLLTACYKDKPIGFYGSQIHTLSNGIKCSQSIDIIISNEYRNFGIFKMFEQKIYEYSIENDCKLMTVLSNYAGMRAHIKLNTWKVAAKIDNLEFDCMNGKQINIGLFNSASGVYFVKSVEYLKWRFDESPVYKYNKILIDRNLYSYYKIFYDNVNNIRYCDIVEYGLSMDQPSFNSRLFNESFTYVAKENCSKISLWSLPHEELYEHLIKNGFEAVSRERYLCVRIIDNKYNYLTDQKNWHITQSDSEIY